MWAPCHIAGLVHQPGFFASAGQALGGVGAVHNYGGHLLAKALSNRGLALAPILDGVVQQSGDQVGDVGDRLAVAGLVARTELPQLPHGSNGINPSGLNPYCPGRPIVDASDSEAL